jgi:hypothetical protein
MPLQIYIRLVKARLSLVKQSHFHPVICRKFYDRLLAKTWVVYFI